MFLKTLSEIGDHIFKDSLAGPYCCASVLRRGLQNNVHVPSCPATPATVALLPAWLGHTYVWTYAPHRRVLFSLNRQVTVTAPRAKALALPVPQSFNRHMHQHRAAASTTARCLRVGARQPRQRLLGSRALAIPTVRVAVCFHGGRPRFPAFTRTTPSLPAAKPLQLAIFAPERAAGGKQGSSSAPWERERAGTLCVLLRAELPAASPTAIQAGCASCRRMRRSRAAGPCSRAAMCGTTAPAATIAPSTTARPPPPPPPPAQAPGQRA